MRPSIHLTFARANFKDIIPCLKFHPRGVCIRLLFLQVLEPEPGLPGQSSGNVVGGLRVTEAEQHDGDLNLCNVVVDVVVAGEVPDRDLLAATATHGPLVLLFSALKGCFVAASGNVSVNCDGLVSGLIKSKAFFSRLSRP